VDGADWLAGVPRGPALPASVSGSGMGRGLPADAAAGSTSGRCQDAPLWLCSQVISLAAGSVPHTASKNVCAVHCRAAVCRDQTAGQGTLNHRLPRDGAQAGARGLWRRGGPESGRPPAAAGQERRAPGGARRRDCGRAAAGPGGRPEQGLADAARREALKISAYMLAHHAPRGSMLGADRQYSELPTAAPGDAPDAGGAPGARPAAPPQPRGPRRGACCCFCC